MFSRMIFWLYFNASSPFHKLLVLLLVRFEPGSNLGSDQTGPDQEVRVQALGRTKPEKAEPGPNCFLIRRFVQFRTRTEPSVQVWRGGQTQPVVWFMVQQECCWTRPELDHGNTTSYVFFSIVTKVWFWTAQTRFKLQTEHHISFTFGLGAESNTISGPNCLPSKAGIPHSNPLKTGSDRIKCFKQLSWEI